MTMTDLKLQYAVRATPAQLWQALTDGDLTPGYYVGFRAEYDLTPDAPYRYTAGGADMITGTVLKVEPERVLAATFNGRWAPWVAELPESRVTFTLSEPSMPMPGVTLLTCVHEGLPGPDAAEGLESGWVLILSGLKTMLETGSPLAAPADR